VRFSNVWFFWRTQHATVTHTDQQRAPLSNDSQRLRSPSAMGNQHFTSGSTTIQMDIILLYLALLGGARGAGTRNVHGEPARYEVGEPTTHRQYERRLDEEFIVAAPTPVAQGHTKPSAAYNEPPVMATEGGEAATVTNVAATAAARVSFQPMVTVVEGLPSRNGIASISNPGALTYSRDRLM
jgi:hypothetical protein